MVFAANSSISNLYNPWQRPFRVPTDCTTNLPMNLAACKALSRSTYDYLILLPVLWAVAIFMYFGVTFLIVAIEIARRNREIESELQTFGSTEKLTDKLAGLTEDQYPNSVMRPTIRQEIGSLDRFSMEDMNTISSYASVTARGGTALTVFTVLTSITTMYLVALRAVLLPGYGVCGNVTLKLVGGAVLFFTGLMPTQDPRTQLGGARIFNAVFTGFVSYTTVGRVVIAILHLGGVVWYIALTMIGFLLQDDIFGFPMFITSFVLLILLFVAAILQCCSKWIHRNLLLFLAELVLVFIVTVLSTFVELVYLSLCTSDTSTIAFFVMVAPVVVMTVVGILVWTFEPPAPSEVVARVLN